jgi:hypothetical protein
MNFEIGQAIQLLSRTPSTLDTLMRPLANEWVLRNEGPATWSPFDVIGHLIHGEETDWMPRAKLILGEGESRAFEPFDRVAMFEKSQGKTLGELLDTFKNLRDTNLRTLEAMNLTPEILGKRGRHPELGVVTLSQLIASWVVHDLGHIGQIVRVMAKQYREEVGPWKAYLTVLGD